MRARREWVRDKFAELGFTDAHLEETADGSMAVVGSRPCTDPDAPTVLLYAHYDVQPPLDEAAWRTPPFELTEVDGRWYGRGAADCKGNIVMHLAALRALGDDVPVNLKLVVEGSEEQGTGGLEAFVPTHADLLARRHDPGLRHRQRRRRAPGGHREPARHGQRGGDRRGAAPPSSTPACSAAPPPMRSPRSSRCWPPCATTRATPRSRDWTTPAAGPGAPYPPEQFRAGRRRLLEGASLLGDGTVSDMLWARPALTILGIDCPPVVGSAAAIVAAGRRAAEPADPARDAARGRRARAGRPPACRAPWGVHVTVETEATGSPFEAATDGPAYRAMAAAMQEAYGRPMAQLGQGGSIPLCNVFAETYPDAEIILMGVEEPLALIHAPNESVDPSEIASMALTVALFLQRYVLQGP